MPDGTRERVHYRFGPLERRGLIAGWRGGQIASVAGGLVLAVLSLRARPTVPGLLVAVAVVGAALAFACWPVAGRTGEQWCPLVCRWLLATLADGRLQSAPSPGRGSLAEVDLRTPGSVVTRTAPRAPGRRPGGSARNVFEGLGIVACPLGGESGGAEAGMVLDERARTATAVLAVRGHSFALLGPADQDARVSAWARVLAALAREGSDVHRVQWLESCLPDDGAAARRYLRERAVLDPDSPAPAPTPAWWTSPPR